MEYLYKVFTEDRKWLSQELLKSLEVEKQAPEKWQQSVLLVCQDTSAEKYEDVWLRYFLVTTLLIMEKFRDLQGVQIQHLALAKQRGEELMRKQKSNNCDVVHEWVVHLRQFYGHS